MSMNTPLKAPVITIDGPCGVGKGTIAHLLSRKLHWHVLDSGAIYRALGFAAREKGVSLDDGEQLSALAKGLDLRFRVDIPGHCRVILEGLDITSEIRQPGMDEIASKIAIFPGVRTALLPHQRAFAELPGLVADGRDMGTVVFPDATVKVYLEGSAEERAKRRHNQLIKKGINATLAQVFAELIERDTRDSSRAAAPLRPAEDAHIIDSTELTIQQVIDQILMILPEGFVPVHA